MSRPVTAAPGAVAVSSPVTHEAWFRPRAAVSGARP
nr:hypothetical protein [Frigoribacterium sp. PvP032]